MIENLLECARVMTAEKQPPPSGKEPTTTTATTKRPAVNLVINIVQNVLLAIALVLTALVLANVSSSCLLLYVISGVLTIGNQFIGRPPAAIKRPVAGLGETVWGNSCRLQLGVLRPRYCPTGQSRVFLRFRLDGSRLCAVAEGYDD